MRYNQLQHTPVSGSKGDAVLCQFLSLLSMPTIPFRGVALKLLRLLPASERQLLAGQVWHGQRYLPNLRSHSKHCPRGLQWGPLRPAL